MMSLPSCEAETRCLLSVDQCMAYILARWPFRLRRGFMPIRGSASVCWLATCLTAKGKGQLKIVRRAWSARRTSADEFTSDDGSVKHLVHTTCVCEVILLSLDPVFEPCCFPPCSRDFGLHLFGRHIV